MQVIVDTRDLTGVVEQLQCSATDPGGFEVASFSIPTDQPFYRGTKVTILDGLSIVWYGRISEVTVDTQNGRAVTNVACEGFQAALRDNPYSMIYVDRDLTQWQGPGVQRRLNLQANYGITDPSTQSDTTTGVPSLKTGFLGAWTVAPGQPMSEAWYDAGSGNLITSLYYAWKKGPNLGTGATTHWSAQLSSDDIYTASDTTADLTAAGPGSGTLTATASNRRFAAAHLFIDGAGGTENVAYDVFWTVLAVIGNHGLTQRGTTSATAGPGFYPSDIARHALSQAKGIVPGIIQDSTQYIVPHAVYKDPTPPAQVIDDMVKLLGWHWGVWEPIGAFGTSPRLDFRPPPADATAVVARSDCSQDTITQRLGDLYDTAKVKWTDTAGVANVTTVTVSSSLLNEAGLSPRTLDLDAGISTATNATNLGTAALLLSQQAARGSGSVTLPSTVMLPGGGRMPAHLLRPGIDRLRILDLPNAGPVTDTDTRRRDTFRVSRIETTVDQAGTPQTTVDLDDGSNLLEVLQARLAVATLVSGN